jgi:hypothetical protein
MGPRRVNALMPEMQRQQGLGMTPTALDVLDDASVGRVRALSSRNIEARDDVIGLAERRRTQLPTRARRIAEEEISDDARPTPEVIRERTQERRNNAVTIGSFGANPVDLDDNVVAALRGTSARSALRDAAARAESSLDPAERAAAPMLRALGDGGPASARLTVAEVQEISAALRNAGDSAYRSGSPDGPVFVNLGNAIRQAGRNQSDEYAAWLQRYADDSDLLEAATTGRNFVSVSKDPAAARSSQSYVDRATRATEPELAIQRQASGQAVQAQGSNPSGARTVLEGFANDVDQAARARAIGVDADRLQQRAQAELAAVTRAQRASPRIGSESSLNLQDAGSAAGVFSAVTNPARAVGEAIINRVRSRGFNDQEAQALVEAVIDPARTQEVIELLSARMSRREARQLARAIRRQISVQSQQQ